jgi:ribosome maturation factor RimP
MTTAVFFVSSPIGDQAKRHAPVATCGEENVFCTRVGKRHFFFARRPRGPLFGAQPPRPKMQLAEVKPEPGKALHFPSLASKSRLQSIRLGAIDSPTFCSPTKRAAFGPRFFAGKSMTSTREGARHGILWRFFYDSPKGRKIAELVRPVCQACGVELYMVEVHQRRMGGVVKVVIDAPDGVTIQNCQRVSRGLSAALEVEDPITGAYTLEVSSPGVDRRLRDLDDVRAVIGENIRIETHEPVSERRKFFGKLLEVQEEALLIEVDGQTYEVDADNVRKAQFVFDFERK